VVQLIHRVQLLLNLNDTTESRLNGALNVLGQELQKYVAVRHEDIDDKLSETRALLGAQSEVLESAKVVLAREVSERSGTSVTE